MRTRAGRRRSPIAALVGGRGVARARPAVARWPKSGFPPPLPSRSVSFPPYQIKTLANGLQVVVVLHHEQPSVSFRLLVRAGAMQEPADKPGVASFVGALLNQGTTTQVVAGNRERDRVGRRRRRRRLRQRALVRQRRRHQGSDRSRARPGVRHGPASGVRAGGDRSAAQADAVGAAGELRRSGLHRGSRVRSARLRVPSLRPAERRHAASRLRKITRDDLVAFHAHVVRAEQRAARRSSAT